MSFLFKQSTCQQSILILPSATHLTVSLTITIQVVRAATVRCRLPTVATCTTCPSREPGNRAHTVAEVHWFVRRREIDGFGLLLYGPRANESGANRNGLGRVHRAGGTTAHIKSQAVGHAHLLNYFQTQLISLTTFIPCILTELNSIRSVHLISIWNRKGKDQNLYNNRRGYLKKPVIAQIFRYFLLYLQENSGILQESGHNCFFRNPFQFIRNLQQSHLITTNKITQGLATTNI